MKLLPDFTLPDEPVRPGVAWDLGHLRPALLATAVLTVIGAGVALLFADLRALWGVLLGFAIVAVFFTISSWAVALAGRHDDRLTMPAALGSYLIKIGLLGVLLVSLPLDGPIDVRALAASVVAGVILWSAMQILYVVRKRQFYVDYHPPAPKDYDQ
ncbi:hypothetical protein [Cumulibacter manganitolerans]|uniref:hypothetical protein n=1 Tax=Cumulibacter manganitolerans TaxID=1884992 RepID=UPI00129762E2|nr:hypothetical protein [Cumulibacter manganitolerans]